MPMDSGEPIPLEMFKGDPIVLMSQEEIEHFRQEQELQKPGGASVENLES